MMRPYKTFNQMTTLYPLKLYEGTAVDADTQDLIKDWFNYRYVCEDNDEKWLLYFHRLLNEKYARYKLMVLLELSKIPELLNYRSYVTRQAQKGGTVTDVIQDIVSTVAKSVDDQTSDGKHVEMVRGLPQSSSYDNVPGQLPNLDWDTATNQAQSADNAGVVETNIDSLNTRNVNSKRESVDKDGMTIKTDKLNVFEIDLKNTIWSYLKSKEAWEWFQKELEAAFLCIYEFEDLPETSEYYNSWGW